LQFDISLLVFWISRYWFGIFGLLTSYQNLSNSMVLICMICPLYGFLCVQFSGHLVSATQLCKGCIWKQRLTHNSWIRMQVCQLCKRHMQIC